MQTTINWVETSKLRPAASIPVLMALGNGDIREGRLENTQWYLADGLCLTEPPAFWAHSLAGSKPKEEKEEKPKTVGYTIQTCEPAYKRQTYEFAASEGLTLKEALQDVLVTGNRQPKRTDRFNSLDEGIWSVEMVMDTNGGYPARAEVANLCQEIAREQELFFPGQAIGFADAAKMEAKAEDAERLLRLACAYVCNHDLGDQSLEFLRSEQSNSLNDITLAIQAAWDDRHADSPKAVKKAPDVSQWESAWDHVRDHMSKMALSKVGDQIDELRKWEPLLGVHARGAMLELLNWFARLTDLLRKLDVAQDIQPDDDDDDDDDLRYEDILVPGDDDYEAVHGQPGQKVVGKDEARLWAEDLDQALQEGGHEYWLAEMADWLEKFISSPRKKVQTRIAKEDAKQWHDALQAVLISLVFLPRALGRTKEGESQADTLPMAGARPSRQAEAWHCVEEKIPDPHRYVLVRTDVDTEDMYHVAYLTYEDSTYKWVDCHGTLFADDEKYGAVLCWRELPRKE